jgi:hypothetical protein
LIGDKRFLAAAESGCCTSAATLSVFFLLLLGAKHPGDAKKVEVPMMQRTFFEGKKWAQVGLVVVVTL